MSTPVCGALSQIVTARRVQELQPVLAQHGTKWVDDLETEHGDACAEWQRALDSLLDLRGPIASIRALPHFTTTAATWAPPG
jgi:hypothetical protein